MILTRSNHVAAALRRTARGETHNTKEDREALDFTHTHTHTKTQNCYSQEEDGFDGGRNVCDVTFMFHAPLDREFSVNYNI